MKAKFLILIVVCAGMICAIPAQAQQLWYYYVTGGSGTIKAGPFASHDAAEAAAQKERDIGYSIPESNIVPEGNGSSPITTPSVPGLNPGQQMMLNSAGQVGNALGQAAGEAIGEAIRGLFNDSQRDQAIALNQQGLDAFQRGDYQTAINCFAQALKFLSNDTQIQANLYRAYGWDSFEKAIRASRFGDTLTELAELRESVAYFGKSNGFVSGQHIQKELADARRKLSQLEDTLRRNRIAADLNGVLKLSGTPDLGGLKTSGISQITETDPNNPLGLKLSGLAQLTAAANDSSSFDGGPGSTLNTSTVTATDLSPKGTSFFGAGGGPKYSTPEPTGDPNVVDLRDANTTVVDPAVVKGLQPQGGAGVHQDAADELPPSNPTTRQTLASANLPDAANPLGLKLGDSHDADNHSGGTENFYRKGAGYVGPLTSPGPPSPPQGALGAKLVRFQGVIDAMYAADGAYTTNRHPPGYSILQRFTLIRDGTDAVLYGKTDATGEPVKLVLAFRGTVPSEIADVTYKDGQNAAGGSSQAYISAVLIARRVQKEFQGVPLTLTGHSLGGGEAALASVATGMPAITFNAAGVKPSDYGYSASSETSQITNYHILGEPLTTVQNKPTLPILTTPAGLASAPSLPTALGNQVSVSPVTLPSLDNSGNHDMSSVEPAIINLLSQ